MKKKIILFGSASMLLVGLTTLFRLYNWEGSNRVIYVAILILSLITAVLVIRHRVNKLQVFLIGISSIVFLIIGTGIIFKLMNWSNTIFWPIQDYYATCNNVNANYQSYHWPASDSDILSSRAKEVEKVFETKSYIRSLLIVHNDTLILERYYNGAGMNDAFNIASCTKSIVSAAFGIAIDQGLVKSEHDALMNYLPEYYKSSTEKLKEKITLKHLLTMQAGWTFGRSNAINLSGYDWISSSMKNPLNFEPGTAFSYSNIEPYILLQIIDQKSEKGAYDFISENLCKPIGITIAHWSKTPNRKQFGAGGIFMTARDMARFGQLYLKNGLIENKQIISEEWIKKSTINYEKNSLMPQRTPASGYGYLWWVENYKGNVILQAAGNGGQHIFVVPKLNMVVVTTAEINVSPRKSIDNSLEIIDAINKEIFSLIDMETK